MARAKERRDDVPSVRDAIRECAETTSIPRILELSCHDDASVRLAAVKQLCPCRVREDIHLFWERIFTMCHDSDARVRSQILHTICDGSPAHLEEKVVEALDVFNRDVDADIRRRAHKVMTAYRHTGKWNVL